MRNIKLNFHGVGRYDDVSPYLITDNTLLLQIELPNSSGEFYLAVKNNGTLSKYKLSEDGLINIEGLCAGEFYAEVKHYLKGELIKVYKIEPLILKEAEGSLSAIPEIEELRRKNAELVQSFKDYVVKTSERKQKLNERIRILEKNLAALVSFAYNDYVSNVYLNGGTTEDFITEFGFELSEEQIKILKGETQND